MDQSNVTSQAASKMSARRLVSIPRIHPPEWVRGLLRNRKASIGLSILVFFVIVAIFANQIAPTRNASRIVGPGSKAPSADFILGTSRQGQDIFAQVVHGTRISLTVGFATGTVIIIIAIVVGVSAGYIGGWVDDLLSLITNVVLILPGLPLIIVVAGWLDRPGPLTVILVLSVTSWAYGARVLRSQTLAVRNSEFVAAARVVGEPTWRIIVFEILPNMTSLVVSSWIGAVLYAILSEAVLEFIGLGDANAVTWGTTLYWAQNNQALLTGNWWAFIPPGICIALVGFSLTLINYGIDEITNPRLRSDEGKQ
ncbi:MAG: ABC transporter permease [Anaerolineae bacterium]|nr:ABC transporter permease [Anaerolineae bacterium]